MVSNEAVPAAVPQFPRITQGLSGSVDPFAADAFDLTLPSEIAHLRTSWKMSENVAV